MGRRREELSKSWGEHKELRERKDVGTFEGKAERKAEGMSRGMSKPVDERSPRERDR